MSSGGGSVPERNVYKETMGEINAKSAAAPNVFDSEARWRPQFADLGVDTARGLLLGDRGDRVTGGSSAPVRLIPGENGATGPRISLYGEPASAWETAPGGGSGNGGGGGGASGGLIGLYGDVGNATGEAFRQADPDTAALLDMLNSQAREELALGSQLDPDLARTVTQGVRNSRAAAGWGWGPNDAVAEGYALGDRGQLLRTQRRAFAGEVAGMNTSLRPDPLSLLLTGYNMQSSANPIQFSPSVNANDIYDSNFNAANARRISNANNKAAMVGGGISAVASIAGAAL